LTLAPEQHEAGITRSLYIRYGGWIYQYCLYRLQCPADAEDAAQTTFLNALHALRRGATPRLEAAWLFTIARNVCINHRRSTVRRRRVETPRDLDALPDALLAADLDADDTTVLLEALSTLPAQQRRTLLLREVQGFSCKEIAEELDLTTNAVQMLLFRARRSTAQRLRELGQRPEESGTLRCLECQTQ
jgi:RNA polymerase sigma-70 factor (ECF subfamily)